MSSTREADNVARAHGQRFWVFWGDFPFVSYTSFARPSTELAERFPTVPWASANPHALAVVTWATWHLITATVARAYFCDDGRPWFDVIDRIS